LASNTKRSSNPEAAEEEDTMAGGTELRWWSWCWIVVIKMISEIPKSCVQRVEVALKLGLTIRDLLVLL
jgi:hypothetical protein